MNLRPLLYPALLPIDLFGVPFTLFVGLCFGKVSWNDGCVVATVPHTRFKDVGAWTLGHAKIVFADQDMEVVLHKHEGTHVKQLEQAALAGLVMAAMCFYWAPYAALAIWSLCPILVYVAGYLVAVAYGGNAYRDNPNEVAAYDHAGQQ